MLNVTGDQDICYYNFLCAHPLGVLSDFNHVYSNVGYVLLGLLFIGLVKRRDLMHQEHIRANDRYEQVRAEARRLLRRLAFGLGEIWATVLVTMIISRHVGSGIWQRRAKLTCFFLILSVILVVDGDYVWPEP